MGKGEQIIIEMEGAGIDLLGVTESQLREDWVSHEEKWSIMTKGRSRNKRRGGRGVGILLRRNMGWEWEQIKIKEEDENEDIMVVKMENKNTSTVIIIMVVYMTVEGKQWSLLENRRKLKTMEEVRQKWKEEEIIIMGYFNAHIGILGEAVNQNGRQLMEWMEGKDMEILNLTMGLGRATWERNELNQLLISS